MKTILTLALTFAASVAALPAAPAAAQAPPAEATLAVSYVDLDLRSEAGIRTLDRRILTAVQQACGPISDFDPAGRNRIQACRADALERLSGQRDTVIAAAAQSARVRLAGQR